LKVNGRSAGGGSGGSASRTTGLSGHMAYESEGEAGTDSIPRERAEAIVRRDQVLALSLATGRASPTSFDVGSSASLKAICCAGNPLKNESVRDMIFTKSRHQAGITHFALPTPDIPDTGPHAMNLPAYVCYDSCETVHD
jgi:hypothetical protein